MRVMRLAPLAVLALAACGPKPQPAAEKAPSTHAVREDPDEGVAGPQICGKIELAPAVAASFKAGTPLYVFAKPQPGAGPPTAVRRYAPDGFPFPFCLSAKNTMVQGLKFEGKVYVTARLDVDVSGVMSTPGDLEGVTKTAVDVGTNDLVLTIDTLKGS